MAGDLVVLLLVKVSLAANVEQVLHLGLPLGIFPGVAWVGGFSSGHIRRSWRFFWAQHHITGGGRLQAAATTSLPLIVQVG